MSCFGPRTAGHAGSVVVLVSLISSAFGQCFEAQFGPGPDLPTPPGTHWLQAAFTARPLGAAQTEVFRLWLQPALLEVVHVDANGNAVTVDTVRLLGAPSSPSPTEARRLAVDGDTLVVSTRDFAPPTYLDQGKVLVYERSGGRWQFQQSLAPLGTISNFGSTIAISGDRIAACDSETRTVHVFERTAQGWVEATTFSDPVAGLVDLDGDRLAVGPSLWLGQVGAPTYGVRVYGRVATGSWSLEATIPPPAGAYAPYFGFHSMALDDGWLAVGAPEWGYTGGGGVALYARAASGAWERRAMLEAPPGLGGIVFGRPIDLDGEDLAVAGFSPQLNNNVLLRYERTGGSWSREAYFDVSSNVNPAAGVALAGDRIVVSQGGVVQVLPWTPRGSTVHFQYWYPDPAVPQGNLSDSLIVTFCP